MKSKTYKSNYKVWILGINYSNKSKETIKEITC